MPSDQLPSSHAPAWLRPAASADVAPRLVRRAQLQWVLVGVAAMLFGAALYWLAVQTATGQTIENAAHLGGRHVDPGHRIRGQEYMGVVTVASVAAATLLVALIGLLRRQRVLAVAGVSIILVGQAITQILKHVVLPRPDLSLVVTTKPFNTLPSGHTTVAMTLLFALLLVVPYRYRGIAMFISLLWAVSMGAFTIAAGAHRLSDTLAADAVSLAVACAASIVLARTDRLRAVVSPSAARYTLRTIFVAVIGSAGVAALLTGMVFVVTGWTDGPLDKPGEVDLYLGSHALAFAGSVITALVFWWTWYRLEAKRRRDPQVVV